MAKKKWYQQGKAGAKRAKEEAEAAKARRDEEFGPQRFWLENDSSAKITFLDTPTFFFYEHNLKINNKWFNYETCLKDFDTCPACEEGLNPSYVVAGTCISHKKFKQKDGTVVNNQKQLFVAKGRALEKLLKQIERRDGDLSFCTYEMARGASNTECNTGEDFEFLKRLEKKVLKKIVPDGEDASEWLEPFDYEEEFAPLSAAKFSKLLGGEAAVGSEEEDKEKEEKDKKKKKPKDDDDDGGSLDSIDDLL